MSEVIISQSVLEQLRCSICKAYLSCPPIRVSSDGHSICGRCSPSDDTGPTYRHLSFEAIVNKLSFPCEFKEYGCEEILQFGHTDEHEEKCCYRSVRCPILPVCQHLWTGSILQLPEHFTTEHPSFVMRDSEFEVEMGWNNEGIIMMVINAIPFFIKYQYNINAGILLYDVRFIALNVQEASYKIAIINNVDRDYSFRLKGDFCLPYDTNICNTQSSKYLFIKEYLKNLGNPDRIAVALTVNISKMKDETLNIEQDPRIDYEVLESMRCSRCRGYLVPPIYDSGKGVVCFNCSKRFSDCKPSENEELKEYITKTNYPCRWHGCDFIEKGENLHKHERKCKFRVYNCLYCNDNFKRETALNHLKIHSCQQIFDTISYKMTFNQSPYFYRKFFMVKDNEIIYILCNTKCYCDTGNYHHTISLESSNNSVELEGKLYFQHSHCKIKSKIFTVNKSMDIRVGHLPDCYRESDELTVTLSV